MNTEELRARAIDAINGLPPKALEKLVELLEEMDAVADEKGRDELIERLINENKGLLMRLAEYDRSA